MISRNFNRFTWKQFIVLLVVLYVGLCVFNYTNAQNGGETSNISNLLEDDVPDYRGLFDNESTVAQNYISNGNFYSQDKPRKLIIDTSLIDKVEAACLWYDKVLNEFPGTEEANEALRQKIRTLIGWEKGYGKDKKAYGLHSTNNLKNKYALVESTFLELEVDYPNDPYLEALAFQIAQRYLYHFVVFRRPDHKNGCKKWLNKTIELARGKDTFYSHLAKLRLRLVETKKPKGEAKPKHEALTR